MVHRVSFNATFLCGNKLVFARILHVAFQVISWFRVTYRYRPFLIVPNDILQVGYDSGTTAIVALLHGNQLSVANVGDSRCVLCRSGIALEMSVDHKPEDEHELNRIHKAGGKVTCEGRVNGGLNLSRALGTVIIL